MNQIRVKDGSIHTILDEVTDMGDLIDQYLGDEAKEYYLKSYRELLSEVENLEKWLDLEKRDYEASIDSYRALLLSIQEQIEEIKTTYLEIKRPDRKKLEKKLSDMYTEINNEL